MRAEDKDVDGRELEREQRLAESELETKDEEALPEVHADQQRGLERTERGALLAAVRAILDGEHVIVATLRLPAHELRALEALQEAVEGRDGQLDMFVFAADRRGLLEQALAVLQPNLAYDDETYVELVARVGDLRRSLGQLEQAQDELEDKHPQHALEKKPAGEPADVDPDAPKPASTLSTGPDVKDAPKPASALSTGPDVKDAPKPATTLSGGPDAKEEAKSATSLGDEKEIEAAQAEESPKKKSWWKRMLS